MSGGLSGLGLSGCAEPGARKVRRVRIAARSAVLVVGAWLGAVGVASAAPIERVSVANNGSQVTKFNSGDFNEATAISDDGRLVAFTSVSNLFGPSDENGSRDLYVRDRLARTTQLVSIGLNGKAAQTSGPTFLGGGGGSFSADGRFVAFESQAGNLVVGDSNGNVDSFVRDLRTGTTIGVSRALSGSLVGGIETTLSPDGTFVAFESRSSAIVSGDTNSASDIFLRKIDTGDTWRVSVDESGSEIGGGSSLTVGAISRDNRFVLYGYQQRSYLFDRTTGTSQRISEGRTGLGDMSDDGRFVVLAGAPIGATGLQTLGPYVLDRQTGAVSESPTPWVGSVPSGLTISGDGRYVAYIHRLDNPYRLNLMRWDRQTGTVETLASGTATNGLLPNYVPVSGDGRNVAFTSGEANLVADDTNAMFDAFVHGELASDTYVALGDSFTSGTGAGDYDPDTVVSFGGILGNPKCVRSPHAYPQLLVGNPLTQSLRHVACHGATTASLLAGAHGEGSQAAQVNGSTKTVTIGIGGNDLDFAEILKDCVKSGAGPGGSSCEKDSDQRISNLIGPLVTEQRIEGIIDDVRQAGGNPRILLVGYPRFFPADGLRVGFPGQEAPQSCEKVDWSDQLWINEKIKALNTQLERNVAERKGVEYVDVYSASEGHELCRQSQDPTADTAFMHGIRGDHHDPRSGVHVIGRDGPEWESFHPTRFGHERIAERVRAVLAQPQPGQVLTVQQGEAVDGGTFSVTNADRTSVSAQWPGSDVVLTLRSPSGRVITRGVTGADIEHHVGPTSEDYTITTPEPGVWTVELYGADVDPGGEPVRLITSQHQPENRPPTPTVRVTQDGWRVEVDAAGTTDPEGDELTYQWDFDTETQNNSDPNEQSPTIVKEGVRAAHTYTTPGRYAITLIATDSNGNRSFITTDVIVVAADSTGPTITLTAPGEAAEYARGAAVNATFSCADEAGGSGIATCTGSVADGQPIDTTTLGTKDFTVTATDNAGNTASTTVTYTVVDKTAPTIAITAPTDNQSIAQGTPTTAAYSCQDETGGSGVALCNGSVPSGQPIDTATAGTKTFTVTATDVAGNTRTLTHTYIVTGPTFAFTGFFQPVDNQPTLNTVNAGRAIPVKFGLGGNQGLDVIAAGYPTVTQINCATGVASDEIEQTSTAGSSSLSYDTASGQYTYTWKTTATWANSCRRLTLRFTDGTQRAADFKFR